ncbi:hypothetical protein KL905_000739 [Ogataea polymorpha]|nr:hypothetical protein KL937_001398 [Ogataea polymorpha]KAG7894067.1 hypothetical protein KL908_002344 [Ogataea polymorpha]KAG7910538.1 hypothetical protein KL907_001429 [Ogataea polymorpha]KAG7923521.1 hypothetical protein KL905_000739 [Ogataea polymorpha]KAG7938865.1 hypothetical protein KL904_001394 [Ogataea polymorpha]
MAFLHYSSGLDSDFANRRRIQLAKRVAKYAASQVASQPGKRIFNPDNRPKNANKGNGILENSYERWIEDGSPSLVEREAPEKAHAYSNEDAELQTLICGDEIIPSQTGIARSHVNARGSLRSHVRMLTTLLHINLTQGRWETSYRIFALLVRIYGTDTREMWPVGLEILKRLNEKETGYEDDPVKARERVNDGVPRRYQPKIYRFLRFLQNSHDTKSSEIVGRYPYQVVDNALDKRFDEDADKKDYQTHHFLRLETAPLFKSGSKTHLAMYIVSLLWELTVAGQQTQFYELEEMLKLNFSGESFVIRYLRGINKVREGLQLERDGKDGAGDAISEGEAILREMDLG